ncbi:MAG: Asp23/Gls24 family envelope stress response protein [Succiniclasticum sp.]|jgi:uncharacterized alkaline shock family protein YloU|nr:Asp23/Gls24 family envelope stress response protein [Succiniclasticum sp.]MEE3479235.1 Asp23/Gls24 family envelope stress response protein [Succiniclasticum sp.]
MTEDVNREKDKLTPETGDAEEKKTPAAPADDSEEEVGYIEVADEVIAIVASLAALDVPGVVDMSTGFREGLSNFLGKKSPARGVRVKVTGHTCRIAIYVIMEYGCNIPEVAMKLQKKVKAAVDDMTEYDAEFVDVHVEGVKRREKSALELSLDTPEEETPPDNLNDLVFR